jgi:hypothetical protein
VAGATRDRADGGRRGGRARGAPGRPDRRGGGRPRRRDGAPRGNAVRRRDHHGRRRALQLLDGALRRGSGAGRLHADAVLDYEDQTPVVLVESPLPFDEVSSPLVFNGTANTFEATFSFEIQDSEGEIIASDFATATSGTGTRGTFDVSQPFVVDEDTSGALVVFELSAEDGSRTREIDVPLELLE